MSDLSFLPEDYVEKKLQRRTNLICVGLFAVVVVAVVAAFYVTDQQRHDVRKLQASVNNQFAEAARRLEQLDQLQERKEQAMSKAQLTTILLEKVPRSLLLSEMVNNMPLDLTLTDMTLETKVVRVKRTSLTALEDAKKKAADAKSSKSTKKGKADDKKDEPPALPETEVLISVTGLAPTDLLVAQFMGDLSKCLLFTDLNLAFSEQMDKEDANSRRFRIDMKLNQDIDLQKYQPLRVARDLKLNPMKDAQPAKGTTGEMQIIKATMVPTPADDLH